MESYHVTGFHYLQAAVCQSLDGSTSVRAPQRPLMSLATNIMPIDNVPGAPSREDTPNEETTDPRSLILHVPLIQQKTSLRRLEVRAHIVRGESYGRATGL